MNYIKGLTAISLIAGVVLFSSAADAKPTASVNCDANRNNNVQAAVDAASPGDTIFVNGTCTGQNVSITKDDIMLSGNEAGADCDKADPSMSAGATIDGTVTIDGVRANLEFLEITGNGSGVLVTNRANAHLTYNDISNNQESGAVVIRTSNAVLTDNTLSSNGQRSFGSPFIFFDAGLYVLSASNVRSNGNTYKDNQYSAVDVERQSAFRSGSFLPREPGHAPIPGETDTIIQKGGDPANAATCKANIGPIAVETFNSGLVDLRNANVCGIIESAVNSSFRVDDAGGEIIGNVFASNGSYVRISDRSNLGNGRLTTFDGTLTCSGGSGTFGGNVSCGQTCSGGISATGPGGDTCAP